MHALPDALTRLTPERLLRRLRLVPAPDTPETVAAKCQAARGAFAALSRALSPPADR
jgi:hypothetical protein